MSTMSRRPRRNRSQAFKARMALEAVKDEQPSIEIAERFRRTTPADHQVEAAALSAGRSRRLRCQLPSFKSTLDEANEPDLLPLAR